MQTEIPIIIQARQSSRRMPSKVMTTFCESMKMIEFQYNRLKTYFNYVIVATSNEVTDDEMCSYMENKEIKFHRGSLNNVMERLIECHDKYFANNSQWFVRVGGDDPLVSIEGIKWLYDELLSRDDKEEIAMIYNSYNEGMIYGCGVEIFNTKHFREVLAKTALLECDRKDLYREHTKPAFHDRALQEKLEFKVVKGKVPSHAKNKSVYLSIDYPQDFLLCSYIANQLVRNKGIMYGHNDLIEALRLIPERLLINRELHDGFGE